MSVNMCRLSVVLMGKHLNIVYTVYTLYLWNYSCIVKRRCPVLSKFEMKAYQLYPPREEELTHLLDRQHSWHVFPHCSWSPGSQSEHARLSQHPVNRRTVTTALPREKQCMWLKRPHMHCSHHMSSYARACEEVSCEMSES